MASDLKEKKFGYMYAPPPPPVPYSAPGTQDWVQYINSYLDVRARQIYDKLKSAINSLSGSSGSGSSGSGSSGSGSSGSGSTDTTNTVKDYLLLKDQVTSTVYKITMNSGILCSEQYTAGTTSDAQNYILLKDSVTGTPYKISVNNAVICSEQYSDGTTTSSLQWEERGRRKRN